MPNVRGVTDLNGATNLITVTLGNGTLCSVTRAEAQAYLDAHPTFTDAQIETQLLTLLQGRWTGRTDNLAVHLISRSPLTVTIWVTNGSVPAQWWL